MPKLTIHTINYLRTGYQENDISPEDYIASILEYNEHGFVTAENNYNADASLQSASTTQYDDQNRPIVVCQYDAEGTLCERVVNSYNDAGQLAEQKMCYGEGLPEYATRYVYENGLLLRRDCYDEGVFVNTEKKYEYDDHGRVIKEMDFDEDGNPLYVVVNQYDENGRLASYTRDEIQQHDRRTFAFEYDERGNKIKDLIYNYDEALIAKIYTKYNENNQTVEVEEEDLDHYRLTKYEYEGLNLVKMSVFTKEGQLISWSAYTYDPQGRVLTQENYALDEVNPSSCRLMSHIDYIRE